MTNDYTPDELENLEIRALQQLTESRLRDGPLPPEAEDQLHLVGVYWDDEEQEYISLARLCRDTNSHLLHDMISFN